MSRVVYTVAVADPRAHLFEISCLVEQPDPAGQRFRLPSWIRGSYLVRDFAKHVVSVSAHGLDQGLAVQRIDKRSLRCAPCTGPLTLRYRVYAFDASVRKAYLDLQRGFFNGSSLFYSPQDIAVTAWEVELRKPADPQCADWRVATTLPALAVDARGFGRYRAEDYEALIDHPVEMGAFARLDFDVDGIPHALVLAGAPAFDEARVVDDLRRICAAERALFAGEPRLDQYLFLTNVVGNGYGGLEHRSSTALTCARKDLPRPGDALRSRNYLGFLSLCSHEYFHLWNVKRITAQALAESDLGGEAYTRDLWHYEGVTSYYDDLFLLRAGIVDAAGYLDLLAVTATRMQRMPGAQVQTLADASFEAWIKYYQPDESTPNYAISYYTKGALVALCLDLNLRLHGFSLDALMRAAWQRWGRSGVGVPEGGLESLAQSMSGVDLSAFFDLALRSTHTLPIIELLSQFGVNARLRATQGAGDDGGRAPGLPRVADLGLRLQTGSLRVTTVLAGGPGERAGVHAGDELLALDGWRLAVADWDTTLSRLVPGRAVQLHLFRDGRLLDLTLISTPAPADSWEFTLETAPDARTLARRQHWLGA